MKRALLFALLIVLPAAGTAGATHISLKNGCKIEAAILKENDESVFVDLGYMILRIPKADISAMQVGDGEQPPESSPKPPEAGAEEDAAAVEETSPPQEALYKAATREMHESTADMTATQVVERFNDSVVVVSSGSGWGSGFVIHEEGYIVTNNHVIGGGGKINVTLFQKKKDGIEKLELRDVEILANNGYFDVALLKFREGHMKSIREKGFELKPVTFGRMDFVKKGDAVFAIGNPGLGREVLNRTVSEGIVSSRARNITGLPYIQTTAAVNPGNSGGPLFNAKGHVIGIVTLKAFYQEGIAFALPPVYIIEFLKNRDAFAHSEAAEGGIRYLNPPRRKPAVENGESPGKTEPEKAEDGHPEGDAGNGKSEESNGGD